jgi:hypothetical protein
LLKSLFSKENKGKNCRFLGKGMVEGRYHFCHWSFLV